MKKVVSMDDIVPLIKEQIKNNGEVSFTPKGNSMLPLLRNNKDTVTIGKADGQLKKYQMVLYLRSNGQYVLHRIVKVEKNGYVMRGDNQFVDESGITNNQILGVVNSFMRKEKRYTSGSISYKIYCRVWLHTIRIRKSIRICRIFAGKVKRKILGKNI